MSEYYIGFTSDHDPRSVAKHHGVLGQKWGRRNGPPYPLDSDISTGKRLKYPGADPKSTRVLYESTKKVLSDPEVAAALKELDSVNSLVRKYNEDETIRDKYAEAAAKKRFEDHAKEDPSYNEEDLKNYINWYKYDDGDQGDFNSFQMYLLDKGIHPSDQWKHSLSAKETFDESVSNAIQKLNLDEWGTIQVHIDIEDGWGWGDERTWNDLDKSMYNAWVADDMGYMSPAAKVEASEMLKSRKNTK